MIQENIINYLLTNGRGNDTWLALAKKFNYREDLEDSKRAKSINDLWRNYQKKSESQISGFEKNARIKSYRKYQNKEGAWLSSISYENVYKFNEEEFKKGLVSAIAEYELPKFEIKHAKYTKVCALINLFDAHISVLSRIDETGQEANTDKSIKIFENCFDELLSTTSAFMPEIIVFPIGNDFFHENGINGTTKKGTPLNVSGNHFDNFYKGLRLIRQCIDKASLVARVYVPLVTGNHDEDSSIYLATALAEIYKNHPNVEIDSRRISRKYFRYGTTLLGFTHGESIKPDSLPLIMAVEQSQAFAETTERMWLMGHFHHLATKEYPGVTVRTLRSLATTDKWHFDNGFIGAKKQGTVMLFSYDEGLKSEFCANIK